MSGESHLFRVEWDDEGNVRRVSAPEEWKAIPWREMPSNVTAVWAYDHLDAYMRAMRGHVWNYKEQTNDTQK